MKRTCSNGFLLLCTAGENTLEAQLARLLTRSIAECNGFSANHFRSQYIEFMQRPGSHNDTYASTCHRMFFANLVRGVAPEDCADNDGHNVDAIDALTLTVPVILSNAEEPRDVRNKRVKEVIYVTRRTRALDAYAEAFADMLVDVLHGCDLREAVEKCGRQIGDDDGISR